MEYEIEPLVLRVADPAAIRLAQITDTHLFADPAETYDGCDTAATLNAVIAHVVRTVGVPDALLLTGDTVEDAVPAAYTRLAQLLDAAPGRIFCLPGNHDDPLLLRAAFPGGRRSMPKVVDAGPWRIVLLDSWQEGKSGGRLAAAELGLLDSALREARQKPALVLVHHQPVPVGSSWMDAMGMENGADLVAVIDRHPGVRAVVWGHIHQEFALLRNGVQWLGTPSTCVQFPPGATEYRITGEAPGYRVMVLRGDGRLETSVVRVP
jgi:Icc protein